MRTVWQVHQLDMSGLGLWTPIKWYSAKGRHCMVGIHIKKCDWKALACQLSKDIRELLKVFGYDEYKQMTKVLDSVRDRYFFKLDPENPVPSEKADILMFVNHRGQRRRLEGQPKSTYSFGDRTAEVLSEVTKTDKIDQRKSKATDSSGSSPGCLRMMMPLSLVDWDFELGPQLVMIDALSWVPLDLKDFSVMPRLSPSDEKEVSIPRLVHKLSVVMYIASSSPTRHFSQMARAITEYSSVI